MSLEGVFLLASKKPLERPKETREVAKEFVRASEELLSRKTFFDATQFYSGSLYPHVLENIDAWRHSGAIPLTELNEIYSPGTIADLSSIGAVKAREPKLEAKFKKVYEESMEALSRDDLYARMAKYQDSLMRLASSSRILQDTISEIKDGKNAWVEKVKTNLIWIKKTVTMSVAGVYQAFGKLFDNVTLIIDEITAILSRWASGLKNELVEKFRELSQHFLELLNSLISALFSWVSKLREIAQEKGFRLNKVTVTLDPLEVTSISLFGFSIPIPAIKLPKIEMEFS